MLRWVVKGAFLALVAGCGGSDDNTGDTGDTDVAAPCPSATAIVTGMTGEVIDVDVGTLGVVWLQRQNVGQPTQVWVQNDNGNPAVMIHESRDARAVVSVAWAGERVAFLEAGGPNEPSTLFLDEPTNNFVAEQLGQREFDGLERIADANAEEVLVLFAEGGVTLDRIATADGFPTRLGTVANGISPSHFARSGDEFYFRAGIDGPGNTAIYNLSGSDMLATPRTVGTIGSDAGCGFPVGGLVATPSSLICGLTSVTAFDRASGGNARVILEELSAGEEQVVFGASGETVFVADLSDSVELVALRAVASDGSSESDLVCDMREVLNRRRDVESPDVSDFQFAVGDGRVVWTQERRGTVAGAATLEIMTASF